MTLEEIKETQWTGWDPQTLVSHRALYHFSPALKAYGDVAAYDLRSAAGLLEYVTDFANGAEKRGAALPEHVRPVGRERLQRLLHVAVHGPSAPGDPELTIPSNGFLDDLRCRAGNGIKWLPRLERTAGGAEWHYHAFVLDADAFYVLIATLLMEEKNRDLVGQCRYKPCGKFFIVEKRPQGRPESRYCGPEHRKAANDDDAPGRQRRVRARRLLERKYGRDLSSHAVKLTSQKYPEITMTEQLADHAKSVIKSIRHFGDIAEGVFPEGARIVEREQSGDLCLFIDWRLGTDPERKSKRSKSILLRISQEAISDYTNSNERRRSSADALLERYLAEKMAAFDPEHDAPAHVVPPREEWIVTTAMINP